MAVRDCQQMKAFGSKGETQVDIEILDCKSPGEQYGITVIEDNRHSLLGKHSCIDHIQPKLQMLFHLVQIYNQDCTSGRIRKEKFLQLMLFHRHIKATLVSGGSLGKQRDFFPSQFSRLRKFFVSLRRCLNLKGTDQNFRNICHVSSQNCSRAPDVCCSLMATVMQRRQKGSTSSEQPIECHRMNQTL